ncbi:NAD-dependent epimerase/dehydratase family protein [Paenibacillus kribbensis]|uniref:UDP-glucose 4-epimerase n=1 Tax=Paenibacillus kribbensis TaxID=172713 RepID=A0A222WJI3_9BACL|nr:NAD-dependent epimerase/dehydratase family protein [Paenibacillus kribbensis]ASR46138.1 UDP-glucose 4-epimerase [Paenibacillus kribbensis]
MKALVTGGAGFIGSHLVRALADSGIRVHVLDNLTTGNVANVDPRAVLHMADIRSSEIRTLLIRESPDIVFHLAAQADVQHSIHQPDEDADVNVLGTIHLLQACHEASVSKLIFASTSGVYGELQKQYIQEDDPTEPISGYGLSKLTAESYIRLFHRLYGMSYTILRYGNVYGPGQAPKGEGGVVALFMERLKKGSPLLIHGDGTQTRDFVYVKDVVRANIAAMRAADQRTVHVSTGRTTSINRLAYDLLKLHGSSVRPVYSAARPGDIHHSCLSNTVARHWLRWEPLYGISAGLKETYVRSMGSGQEDAY